MENRERLIELLTAVRYTTNDIEKVADEICLLFNVVGQSEQLCQCDRPTVQFYDPNCKTCDKKLRG